MRMRFSQCACGDHMLQRIRRSAWMRLTFPSRGLYYCWSCDRTMLVSLPGDGGETGLSPLTGPASRDPATPAAMLSATPPGRGCIASGAPAP